MLSVQKQGKGIRILGRITRPFLEIAKATINWGVLVTVDFRYEPEARVSGSPRFGVMKGETLFSIFSVFSVRGANELQRAISGSNAV